MVEFLLLIEDMFKIKGRGYVATGVVSHGPLCVNDRVWVCTASADLTFRIVAIESESASIERAERGERVGVLLEGESAELLERGHALCREPILV